MTYFVIKLNLPFLIGIHAVSQALCHLRMVEFRRLAYSSEKIKQQRSFNSPTHSKIRTLQFSKVY
ncbi:hypothetical protein X798_07819 [Onchocerca flexuosa]|uniref:Uncharacterized protein n=1 Tax=Onchocerca flexuosa TaxID=387005 RepID=A0A238BKK3_9BILA|nr:hypothetical protein X798_07819 [Onchocerca flexuosa]